MSPRPRRAPGKVVYGMRVQCRMVSGMLALLRVRHVSVPVFNHAQRDSGRNLLRHVPGRWYVYDAVPWALQQVMLFVGPTRTPGKAGAPVPGTPVPSPSPTG
jgi:hypothetical protein